MTPWLTRRNQPEAHVAAPAMSSQPARGDSVLDTNAPKKSRNRIGASKE
jgi:hypothetical protein